MNLEEQLSITYRQLRLIAGWSLIIAPLLILAAAYLLEPTIKPTLSHYYFAEPNPGLVRTLFTGFLIFVGGILIAYRGFDNRDNWIHNAAGVFAVCVAFFPKGCDSPPELYCTSGLLSPLHAPSAVLVFVFAAWAVFNGGGFELRKRLIDEEVHTLQQARKASLITMTAGVVLYVARPFLSRGIQDFKVTILIVELLGFFGFAFHWLVMTSVIDKANLRIIIKREESKSRERELAKSLDSGARQPEQQSVVYADGEDLTLIP